MEGKGIGFLEEMMQELRPEGWLRVNEIKKVGRILKTQATAIH